MICRDDSTVNTFRPRARPLFQYRHYRYFFLHLLHDTLFFVAASILIALMLINFCLVAHNA